MINCIIAAPDRCRWATRVAVLVIGVAAAKAATAQETGYVSDSLTVPIRSGTGGEYRILHRGLPSGTALTLFQTSEDGEWVEVETRGGIRGWMRSQYLQSEPTAALLLADQQDELEALRAERNQLRNQLQSSESAASEAGGEISDLQTRLDAATAELSEIRRVSGAALELDAQNQQLAAEVEAQRSESELLRLENVRLQERIANNQLLDGALAVLLGVIVAVVAPRLWPRRRRNDGWA